MAMVTAIPLIQGMWESGPNFCPSSFEEWVGVAMVPPSLFYKEGGKVGMTSALLF